MDQHITDEFVGSIIESQRRYGEVLMSEADEAWKDYEDFIEEMAAKL